MKTTDFENFKISIKLNIELDGVLRSITEKIKFIHASQHKESLRYIIHFLRDTDDRIDDLIKQEICKDETEN